MIFIEILVGFSALVAAAYCMVLSRRLRALSRLDGDVGQAIAVLSSQVDAMTRALKAAEATNQRAESDLERQTSRAEAASRRLELMISSLHTTDTDQARHHEDSAHHTNGMSDFMPFGRAETTRARASRSQAWSEPAPAPVDDSGATRPAVLRRRDKARV